MARCDPQHSSHDRYSTTDPIPPMAGMARPSYAPNRHRRHQRANRRRCAPVARAMGRRGGDRLGCSRARLPLKRLADHHPCRRPARRAAGQTRRREPRVRDSAVARRERCQPPRCRLRPHSCGAGGRRASGAAHRLRGANGRVVVDGGQYSSSSGSPVGTSAIPRSTSTSCFVPATASLPCALWAPKMARSTTA